MAEEARFVVIPARLNDMSFQFSFGHLESKKGGKSIFKFGISVKRSLESAFSTRCFWNFGPDLISCEIHPIIQRNLCDRSDTVHKKLRVISEFKYRDNPRRRWLLVSKGRNKPGAVKGFLSEKALKLRYGVNGISRCNANCGGIAMVINAYSHIKLMQVLRCICKIPRMRKIDVLRETKLKGEERQLLTG